MLEEGARVRYEGAPDGLLRRNDMGHLLSISGTGGHVLFSTGQVAGRVQYLPLDKLSKVLPGPRSLLADSLDAPPPLGIEAVREMVSGGGERGLVAALGESGVLDDLAVIAEEAADFVAGRVRSDPSMVPIISMLDAEEEEQVIALTSSLLLRNAAHYKDEDDE